MITAQQLINAIEIASQRQPEVFQPYLEDKGSGLMVIDGEVDFNHVIEVLEAQADD
jgi:hypothetical protein